MTVQLTWTELLIQDVAQEAMMAELTAWSFLLQGSVAPIFLNRFGSWFLRRRDDSVDLLDVLGGSVTRIAETHASFVQAVNTQEWQEHYLASRTVFDLHLAGVVATGSHCYAVKPHPARGGPDPLKGHAVQPDRAMVMPFWMWQSFCRQSLGGPA